MQLLPLEQNCVSSSSDSEAGFEMKSPEDGLPAPWTFLEIVPKCSLLPASARLSVNKSSGSKRSGQCWWPVSTFPH